MSEIYRLKDAELFLMKKNRMIKTKFFKNYSGDMIVKLVREAIIDEGFLKELFQKILIDKDV